MIVIPAIDLRHGQGVRLRRGDPGHQTVYSDDPVALAVRFQEEGARRLHVVDLDAAFGEGSNHDAVVEICRSVQVPVQVGGGIRTLEGIAEVIEAGAARAVLGTMAAWEPDFIAGAVEEFAERVVVAVDLRGGHLMVRGWQEEGPELEPALHALDEAGAPRYLVTSIARDGTLNGPDLRLYQQIVGLTDRPVIASGGVRSAGDIWALRDIGCEAVVTGKAILEGTLRLSQVTRG
jgi:phosphoribosylformimino-5-aminoimidazole carboxamide ribotide isomerase